VTVVDYLRDDRGIEHLNVLKWSSTDTNIKIMVKRMVLRKYLIINLNMILPIRLYLPMSYITSTICTYLGSRYIIRHIVINNFISNIASIKLYT